MLDELPTDVEDALVRALVDGDELGLEDLRETHASEVEELFELRELAARLDRASVDAREALVGIDARAAPRPRGRALILGSVFAAAAAILFLLLRPTGPAGDENSSAPLFLGSEELPFSLSIASTEGSDGPTIRWDLPQTAEARLELLESSSAAGEPLLRFSTWDAFWTPRDAREVDLLSRAAFVRVVMLDSFGSPVRSMDSGLVALP